MFISWGFGDAEARSVGGDFSGEVGLGGVEDLVWGHSVGVFDDEGEQRSGVGVEEAAYSGANV